MESMVNNIFLDSYNGKKVLVTGHTGFKGSWLSIWLYSLGAKVIGISNDPKNKKDNFILSDLSNIVADYRCDIRDINKIDEIIKKEKPDILFHLAAQPLVLDSYKNPLETVEINVQGTANILEIFKKSSDLEIGIFITTDKCYENKEIHYSYKETDPLGGYDLYSASKAASEIIINSYQKSFFDSSYKNICSVRAGNVIGGGDWSENRIVPDCIKAIEIGKPIIIRNPTAIRPWQHVLEPLCGYLLLGSKMLNKENDLNGAWNFGPDKNIIYSVKDVVLKIINKYKSGSYTIEENKNNLHEATYLSLDSSKAKKYLGWKPLLSFDETVSLTVDWYKNYYDKNVFDLCEMQIKKYINKWK